MTWTTPKTWVANDVLTAAELNEQLRDNLLEQMPALATTEGSWFSVDAANSIVERTLVSDIVKETEQTASTSYVDLATVGPEVTVETGTVALVMFSGLLQNSTANAQGCMSYAISGATTRAASDTVAIIQDGLNGGGDTWGFMSWDLAEDLNPGANTFTAKYRAGGAGTLTAYARALTVWPL